MRLTMSDKSMFDEAFPADRQVGGTHYSSFLIQPWTFIRKNGLNCLLYTSPSPRDRQKSRMPSSA